MLIVELLTGCLVAFFSIYPIHVLGASEECVVLHLLERSFTPEIDKSIQGILDTFPDQTELYLTIAIKLNNTEAVKCIINHASQNPEFIMLLENIYNGKSSLKYDDQDLELDDSKFAKLVSKATISAIDVGYLIGLEGMIKLLVEWRLRVSPVFELSKKNEKEILSLLLEQGLDMSIKNGYGENILHVACRLNKPKLVKVLLARNEKNKTKIAEGIALGQGMYDKVSSSVILDINGQNNEGRTPLHYVCSGVRSSKLLALLLEIPEMNINMQDKYGYTPTALAAFWKFDGIHDLFARQDLNVNVKNYAGDTILHVACQNGQLKLVKPLFANDKLNINIQNNQGETPIMSALYYGMYEFVEYLLTRQGLDLNARNNYGNSFLHIACDNGLPELVKELLTNHKVDINIQNKHGETPMIIAENKGFKEIVQLFENRLND